MKQKLSFIVSILILFAVSALAQQPTAAAQPPTYQEKLARIFQEWERPDRPGGVVAVVEKGQVVYPESGVKKPTFQKSNLERHYFRVDS